MKFQSPNIIHRCKDQYARRATRGALLIEALIALSILAGLLLVGTQSILAGLYGAKFASQKDVAAGILGETIDAVRARTDEQWQSVYGLLRSPTKYYPLQSSGKWVLFAGDEVLTVNGLPYRRFFTVEHVSRDVVTRGIETVYDPLHDDPSTQKITATVVWGNDNILTQVEYLSRWRNRVCVQTAWNTPGSVGVKTCPDASYSSATDITAGANLKLTPLP